jgi:hypothetical protein
VTGPLVQSSQPSMRLFGPEHPSRGSIAVREKNDSADQATCQGDLLDDDAFKYPREKLFSSTLPLVPKPLRARMTSLGRGILRLKSLNSAIHVNRRSFAASRPGSASLYELRLWRGSLDLAFLLPEVLALRPQYSGCGRKFG